MIALVSEDSLMRCQDSRPVSILMCVHGSQAVVSPEEGKKEERCLFTELKVYMVYIMST